MSNAQLIKSNGKTIPISIPEEGKLKFLQDKVGGYIEMVTSSQDPDLYVICNEEGKINGLPINYKATVLHRFAYDPLVGDVIICNKELIN